MIQVNTNFAALVGRRKLEETNLNQTRSIERLSTGLRINRAADDPSGLVISEKLRSQISGLNQALENTQNNINLVNTAEAALAEINDILVDIRSSIIFAMNTGFSLPEQIDAEQDKVDQALLAIDRIAQSTRFAQRNLLNGESDFIIEQSNVDKAAVSDLQVRQIRLSPTAEAMNFSVNVTNLAERATVIFNKEISSEDHIASLTTGGDPSDFVTLRITGARGTEDINFGQNATTQDLIGAINQSASATGVFASSYRPLPFAAEVFETTFAGTGASGGFQVPSGTGVTFGLEINGTTHNIFVQDGVSVDTNTGGAGSVGMIGATDGILSAAEFNAALQNALPGSLNVTAEAGTNGDIRIVSENNDFRVGPARNVRVMRFSASDLATAFNAGTGGGANDFDGIQFDLTGSSAADVTVTTAGGIAVGGLDTAAERADFLAAFATAVDGTAGIAGQVNAHFDPNSGDLVIVDTGNTIGSGAGTPGILAASTDSTAIPSSASLMGSFADGLSVLQLDSDGVRAKARGVEFVNIAIPSNHIDSNGRLAINVGAGNNFTFALFDPEDGTLNDIAVTPATGDNVTVDDVRNALRAAGSGLGVPADWDVAFNEDAGLTFVYKNTVAGSGTFRVQNHSAPGPADTTFQAVTGLPTVSSRSNNERLALYSLDFGSEQIISIEDVTNSVSGLTLKSANNGGLMATTAGRDGLGLLAGQADNLANIRGGKFSAVGVDVGGTLNGLSFVGDGHKVKLVSTAIDLELRLNDNWGTFGAIGSRADAVGFGYYNQIGGNQLRTSLGGKTDFPDNVLDTFEFAVRLNFEGGPRGLSGMRFQIRESNSQQDSLNIGIRSMTTANLGLDVAPESQLAGSAQRINDFVGGALNSLRTGGGNDLASNPENALEILDAAIDQVSKTRGFLGSISKDTLSRNLNSVSVAVDSLLASESGIRDVDFARETTEFARQQVLFAAGTSVLGQANQIPQQLLQLLQ